MQSILASLLVLLSATSTALAAPANDKVDPVRYLGEPKCRIAPLEPAPLNDIVSWSGDCEGGFAAGKGELLWHDEKWKPHTLTATLVRGEVQGEGELKTEAYTYIGTLRRGVPHGSGFFTYKGGSMYEGDVVDGVREGKGIMMQLDRSEYTGEWKRNRPDGWGEMKFWDGGSYKGQWQAGKRHGQGEVVYAGSGRRFAGQFENDYIAHTGPLKKDVVRDVSLDRNRDPALTNYLPLDLPWEKLTEPQKNVVRTMYDTLEQGDDPPYPARGPRQALESVVALNNKAGVAEGKLRIHVLVGTDGKAKHVNVFEKPILERNPEELDKLVQSIASVMLLDTYKPAMCRGQPCEMPYQLQFNFDVTNEQRPRGLSIRTSGAGPVSPPRPESPPSLPNSPQPRPKD